MRFTIALVLLVLVIACDFTAARTLRERRQAQNQLRDCIRNCPTTPQYNPVCGSDNNTYDNEAKLKCARRCGAGDITVSFLGTCSPL